MTLPVEGMSESLVYDEDLLKGSIEVYYICNAQLDFETNGYCGGDSGHGGYLRFTFRDTGGSVFKAAIDDGEINNVDSVTVAFHGDAEIGIGINLLKQMLKRLEEVGLK